MDVSFRFVLPRDADTSVAVALPDHPPEWRAIQEVIVPSATEAACPICLCEPSAP